MARDATRRREPRSRWRRASQPGPAFWRWSLLGLTLLAFGLRIYHLDHFSFWLDEALTPARSDYRWNQILSNTIWVQGFPTLDTHPPLYYWLIHVTRGWLGTSDFAYRFPSAVAGTLMIPLLFQMGRRLAGRSVGAWAAFLAAINPAQIWYAQEARMYALLALLGLLASYFHWRALSTRRLRPWLWGYLGVAALGLYTHYTFALLLLGQGLFWAWLLWRQGRRRLLLGLAALVVLATVPILPFTVPRLFTGAENNYFYVPLPIMLQDVVHGFGQGLTADFSLWWVRLLDLGLLGILLLGLWRVAGRRRALTRLFLLNYLLVIVFGLALGSLFKPMYQGIRHIFAGSPAFLLLLALGVAGRSRRWFWTLFPGLLATLTFGLSLYNLYFDPAVAKDDFRSLVAFIEARAGPGDAVLYNDAVQMFLHLHYQTRSDLPVTALPTYPEAIYHGTRDQLNELAAGVARIWYVASQPPGARDIQGQVGQWVRELGPEVAFFAGHSRTGGVGVAAHAMGPTRRAAPPAAATRLDLTGPGQPTLLAWQPGFAAPAQGPALWLDLFWSGTNPALAPRLTLSLRDEHGRRWAEQSAPLPHQGQAEAVAAPVLWQPIHLSLPAGIPPGPYELTVQTWTGDNASGPERRLGRVDLAASDRWPAAPAPPVANAAPVYFQNQLTFLGYAVPDRHVRPGHAVPLTLYWRSPEAPAGLDYELTLLDSAGQAVDTIVSTVGPEPATWPAGLPIAELSGFSIPADASPGVYRLHLAVRSPAGPLTGRPAWRPWRSPVVSVGAITVAPWPLVTTLPVARQPLDVRFGEAIRLAGFRLEPTALPAGTTARLTLIWQASARPADDYRVFVHLTDPVTGEIVRQVDRVPVDWLRPTPGWRPGEVLTDDYELVTPADLTPGQYPIYVGLFSAATEIRPPVWQDDMPVPDGRLLLAILDVQP